jgi:hypothetical protein
MAIAPDMGKRREILPLGGTRFYVYAALRYKCFQVTHAPMTLFFANRFV